MMFSRTMVPVVFVVLVPLPPYHSSVVGRGVSTSRLPVSSPGGIDAPRVAFPAELRRVGPANADTVPEVMPVVVDETAAD